MREKIKSLLTHEQKEEHGNALSHMFNLALEESDLSFMEPWMKLHKSLVPSFQGLQRLGKIPDFCIREFRDLFHPSEWSEVKSSLLWRAEEKLSEMQQAGLRWDTADQFIRDINDLGAKVHGDKTSQAILSIKKDRLARASKWKRDSDVGVKVRPLKAARKHIREEGVTSLFSPQEILVSKEYRGSGEINVAYKYDTDNSSYFIVDEIARGMSEQVRAALNEYVAWLNS